MYGVRPSRLLTAEVLALVEKVGLESFVADSKLKRETVLRVCAGLPVQTKHLLLITAWMGQD